MSPRVSICLPVYNGAQFLEGAIESALAQSFDDFELIVVDDGSQDGSQEIVESYARQDSRLHFFKNHERLGLFGNYNRCIQLATGQFVKPFAQDDLLKPRALAQLLELFAVADDVSLVSCTREWIDERGDLLPAESAHPSAADHFARRIAHSREHVLQRSIFPLVNYIGEPSAVMFRAELVGGGFSCEYKHIGDFEYWLRILRSGTYVCTNETLCGIRSHPAQQTLRNFESLAVACDVLRLAQDLGPCLEKLGLSTDELVSEALSGMAAQLHKLSSSGKIELRADAAAQASEREMFEVAFRALQLVGEYRSGKYTHYGPYKQVHFNERHIKRLTVFLHNLMVDPGWKHTRFLREINQAINPFSQPDMSAEKISLEHDAGRRTRNKSSKRIIEEQETYLAYLRQVIRKLRSSKSWRLRTGALSVVKRLSAESRAARLARLPFSAPTTRRQPRVVSTATAELISEVLYDKINGNVVPKVSVVISVEDESARGTLLGLTKQTMSRDDFEVIVVDAFDTQLFPGDVAAVVAAPGFDLQLRALRSRRGGRALAHNIAVRLARGSLLVFLAGDFVPSPQFVERHWQFHQDRNDSQVIGIGAGVFPPELRHTEFMRWLDDSGSLYGLSFTGSKLELPPNYFYVANSSLRKSAIEEVGWFDERFPYDAWDDYEMGLRLFDAGMRSEFIDGVQCLHHHRQDLNSRAQAMRKAGESACILDALRPGEKNWHDLVRSESPLLQRKSALFARLKSQFHNGDESVRSEYFKKHLDASFASAYINKLRQLS